MDCSTPDFPVLHHLPEFAQTHVHQVGDAIQSFHPLLSLSPPAFSLSSIRVFSNEPVLCIRWPVIGASASVLPMNIQGLLPLTLTGLISLQSNGLSSLPQHHNSKASILRHSAFFMVQLTSIHDCWKNHSFDSSDLCQQSSVSAFWYVV